MGGLGNGWAWAVGAASAVAMALPLGCTAHAAGAGGRDAEGATTDGGSDDGGSSVVSDAGNGSPSDVGSAMTPPCDASSIQLPTDGGATVAACSRCLMSNCSAALATCSTDCVCVSGIECLVANADNATLCPAAMSALGAGNAGLTAISGCLPMNCEDPCHGIDSD